MNLLNKLTIKNLVLNKKRTIVTVIGIMLSVSLITAVSTMYNSAIKSLINFEIREKGDFHVAYYNVSKEEIDTFRNNRSIEELNLVENIGYAKIDSKNEYKPYAYIKAFTKSSLENLSIKLVEGRLPESGNEILIPTHLKTNGRLTLNVGDVITLDVGRRVDNEGNELNQNNPYYTSEEEGDDLIEKIVDTDSVTYKVVGIIERPASNIEGYTAPGYTFITYFDEDNISNFVDIYAKYNKSDIKKAYEVTANIIGVDKVLFEKYYLEELVTSEEIDKYVEQMTKALYDINVNDYLIDLETNPIKNSGVGGLGVVVGIVMAIIVVTSVFCIKNSFDISITEKIKQYGMLRSVGATKKQIRHNVLYEATILGIIGIPLGILCGLLASYILIIVSNYYLGDFMSSDIRLMFSFSVVAIIIAIILGIVTIYASAFKSAKKASHISPIESIRNSGKINAKKVKSPKIINKLFGIGGELSYKNLKRNKKKYRTTVISIIVSVAVFIALTSFMNFAFSAIKQELNISEYNLSLTATDYTDMEYRKIIETTSFDNISNYTILRESELKFSNDHYNQEYIDWLNLKLDDYINSYIGIISLGDYQYKKYIESLNLDYNVMKDKAILMDYSNVSRYNEEEDKFESKYLHIYNFKDHDIISGTLSDESNFSIEIFKVVEDKPFALSNLNNALIVSDEVFNKLFSSKVLSIYYDSSNANKLQDDIDEYLTDVEYSLNNSEEHVRMMNNLFTLIGIFLYGFIIVITLIGITNIFNTITTNMELRRREFAMLKSVGMTKNEFMRMIRLESLFMGLKALIIGIPIGILLSYVIYYYFVFSSGLPYKLPIVAILLAIITVFILISIIMKYSINKINKQNIIETIRNENI